jgi:hypothetical protein
MASLRKFVGFRVLELFLTRPSLEIHLNEQGREVQLTVMQYYRWETMKKEGDKFAESVLRKHVLVSGFEL